MPIPDDLSPLRQIPFSEAVAKLEELMNQNARAFLIGAGCSHCAGLPLAGELTDGILNHPELDGLTKHVLESVQDQFKGAINANIEDYLSELIDLLAIAERRKIRGAIQKEIPLGGQAYTSDQLRVATEHIKRTLASVLDRKVTIENHWQFIRAIHRPIRPGRAAGKQPVDYLVLNYDTLIEDALALEKIRFADGLEGGATGWWNSSTFDQNELAARVLKLHGSINWCEFPDDPLPRRIPNKLDVSTAIKPCVMIWPASTKYRETQRDPYAQIAMLARNILHPSERSQLVLVICGYSFSDSHINIEIDRALRESSGRLTIVVFSSDDQPTGQLKEWHENPAISEQLLIFGRRGFYHGSTSAPSPDELPWWKFENITRLLGGER